MSACDIIIDVTGTSLLIATDLTTYVEELNSSTICK